MPTEIETLNLAIKKNLNHKEIYIIDQEIKPKIGPLNSEQGHQFRILLTEFADLFAKDMTQLGKTDLVMHRIFTEDIPPISSCSISLL